jgi:putative phosphoribosyl transferase
MHVEAVEMPQAGGTVVRGDLGLPEGARGIVVFAHGTGSGRRSPRNRMVAERLRDHGLGTLLMDLLSEQEEVVDRRTRELRFDIGLLAERLAGAAGWLAARPATRTLPLGYFGASTGAAAALVAAAREPGRVGAVVSRGGRPDLAGGHLAAVRAPTLLIVGGLDTVVIGLNTEARRELRAECRLEIVPGATHLFSEPDALEQVARLAAEWFAGHLGTPATTG